MKSLLLALTAFAAFGLYEPGEARAQAPNPLMPNLGVPYTNMQAARSMLYRGNRNRGRNRRRPGTNANRPVIINNYYRGAGPSAPF